jgi:hypothetical protein
VALVGRGWRWGSCDSFAGVAIIISPPRIGDEIARLIEPYQYFGTTEIEYRSEMSAAY